MDSVWRAAVIGPALWATLLIGTAARAATSIMDAEAPEAPRPEECRVAPRSVEEVRQAVRVVQAARAGVTPPPVQMVEISGEPPNVTVVVGGTVVPQDQPHPTPTPFVPPAGRVADPATVAGVTATYRERVACMNALDPLRYYALMTDEQFLRSIRGVMHEHGESEEAIVGLVSGIVGRRRPPEEWLPAPVIESVRILPDGSAGGVAVESDGDVLKHVYVEFAKVGDRWLFDSFPRTIEVLATPTSRRA